jgi:hypothetical protein
MRNNMSNFDYLFYTPCTLMLLLRKPRYPAITDSYFSFNNEQGLKAKLYFHHYVSNVNTAATTKA